MITPKALDSLATRSKIQTAAFIFWMGLLVILELAMDLGINLLLNALVFIVVSVVLVPTFWYFSDVHGRQ